jgi:hypothetical protein
MNAVVPEIDANIRKANTIFAFSVYSCKERSEKYFRRNLPPCFHFCVRFVCRFYFVVFKGNLQCTRIWHVTSTLGSYIRATELIRWPHTHSCHVGIIYIFDTGLTHWPPTHLPQATHWPLTHLQQATPWPRTHLPQANLLASYIAATGRTHWPCTHSLPQDKPVGVLSTKGLTCKPFTHTYCRTTSKSITFLTYRSSGIRKPAILLYEVFFSICLKSKLLVREYNAFEVENATEKL